MYGREERVCVNVGVEQNLSIQGENGTGTGQDAWGIIRKEINHRSRPGASLHPVGSLRGPMEAGGHTNQQPPSKSAVRPIERGGGEEGKARDGGGWSSMSRSAGGYGRAGGLQDGRFEDTAIGTLRSVLKRWRRPGSPAMQQQQRVSWGSGW